MPFYDVDATVSRTSEQLESSYYTRRSADYAWQLFCAAGAIFVSVCLLLLFRF